MESVILEKCASYEQTEVQSAVENAINKLGGIGKFIKPGQKVLLKPNVLGGYSPSEAVTTHPNVVREVIRLVKKAGANPFIGESPGFGSLERHSKVCGIKQASEEEGAPIVEFSTPKNVEFPQGKRFKNLTLAKEIFDFDVIINLPKFKTHGLTGISGAVKNLFGCVPGILKSQYHYKIQKRSLLIDLINDIADYIKPKLNIMDAVWAMEGEGGPTKGNPCFMGIIGVSSSAFDLDQGFIKIINGESVQGFSFPDFKKVKAVPDFVYFLPITFLQKFIWRSLAEKPVINHEKCANCGICVKVCAAEALSCGKNTPDFDYGKCIRCFCCQEMCPEKAVDIRRNKIINYISKLFSRI